METWIAFTLLAVVMQSLRTAAQKQIATGISVAATTLVRFLFGLPFVGLYFVVLKNYYKIDAVALSLDFLLMASLAALAQIFATVFLVKALSVKNFAVGTALVKTEAIMTALFGSWFFSAALSWLGYVSVILGVSGTLLASKWTITLKDLWQNQSIKYGIFAGVGFAMASLWLKAAITALQLPGIFGAATTLAYMVSLQTIICLLWIVLKDKKQLSAIRASYRLSWFIGFTSVAGSIGWFTAIGLQNAALVKTLGQTEFFVSLVITYWYFGEKVSLREYQGMALIMLSVVMLLYVS